jgi:hypothetical protein
LINSKAKMLASKSSSDVIISRENRNFHLRFFVKSGVQQFDTSNWEFFNFENNFKSDKKFWRVKWSFSPIHFFTKVDLMTDFYYHIIKLYGSYIMYNNLLNNFFFYHIKNTLAYVHTKFWIFLKAFLMTWVNIY